VIDCSQLERVRKVLESMGALSESSVVEIDTYYQHPCRDFARTDEALRLRVIGGRVELTYKGPKQVARGVKRRVELTVVVESAEDVDAILRSLGFTPVASVRKKRYYYRLPGRGVKVTLDEVDELGCFVEIEASPSTPNPVEAVEATIRLLGLEGAPRTVKSYLEMVLERREAS
jgi:adenylate cyclase class 2